MEQRLSSQATLFYTLLLPLVWLGVITPLLAWTVWRQLLPEAGWPVIPFFLLPWAAFTTIGWITTRPLARVTLDHDHVRVYERGRSRKIPLSAIRSVELTQSWSTPRVIILHVDARTGIGGEVMFIPRPGVFGLGAEETAAHLRRLVESAKP